LVDDHAIDIASLIDNHPVRLFQMRIMLLCALVAMLDGFDTQVIGFVAPILTSAWQINPAGLGLVFAAGLLGLACGAVFLGPVSDRIGRRAVIIGSTAWFGAFSVLTAQATTPNELALFRFLTGLGLGGAMPNIPDNANAPQPGAANVDLSQLKLLQDAQRVDFKPMTGPFLPSKE